MRPRVSATTIARPSAACNPISAARALALLRDRRGPPALPFIASQCAAAAACAATVSGRSFGRPGKPLTSPVAADHFTMLIATAMQRDNGHDGLRRLMARAIARTRPGSPPRRATQFEVVDVESGDVSPDTSSTAVPGFRDTATIGSRSVVRVVPGKVSGAVPAARNAAPACGAPGVQADAGQPDRRRVPHVEVFAVRGPTLRGGARVVLRVPAQRAAVGGLRRVEAHRPEFAGRLRGLVLAEVPVLLVFLRGRVVRAP